ncbi:MAG TPA: SUMF1/EgtB/PvdO family nonheme iron enzyme [Terriglobales bacterium]|nr:SUMF1/EgtB/PvdO family nonheme iron enzyme [Terriglobales bacterium]
MVTQPTTLDARYELLERLEDARRRTDELFRIVREEALYDRPIAERHRIIFYIGHLEAFDWNLLRERLIDAPTFSAEFDKLFSFGIDPVDGGLPTDQPADWPTLEQVRRYVSQVREAINKGLSCATAREFTEETLLNVAIEHRLMHAETLAYMLHQLSFDRKVAVALRPVAVARVLQHEMVRIPEGQATLGLPRCPGHAFGWDNEFEEQTHAVPPFQIDKYEITNGQYLEFLAAGGYENRNLWTDGDRQWKSEHNISHPVFWIAKDGAWFLRTMFNEIPLPLNWPVYVSHAEASAYAKWAGKSLPSEAQWHRAAYGTPQGAEREYPWGSEAPTARRGNGDFKSWDPAPVDASPDGQSAFGVQDLIGNGWEWTSTLFAPLPGFEPFPFYKGYSADFFDGKHFVIKGGSPRTAACMLRRSFRNWFQPHYQYVYAGFRCVKN